MTKQRINDSLQWAGPLLSVLNLFVLVGGGAWFAASMHHKIEENFKHDNHHHNDPGLHMPFEEKIEHFLTRREWEKQVVLRDKQFYELKVSIAEDMGMIRSDLEEADKKLNRLLNEK
jgi:hypothetical protein